ncbi:hypothetical protein [Aquabacterium sp.]|uniref:hypothetical protein n=1 Tax=Aquabacterium sp. TaxID=1872578 RepID=UPI0027297B49|nr:hypothetical protein [Aquabacterium sp.]
MSALMLMNCTLRRNSRNQDDNTIKTMANAKGISMTSMEIAAGVNHRKRPPTIARVELRNNCKPKKTWVASARSRPRF